MPLGQSVSANIRELSKSKKGQKVWPRKRIIAAAMNAAREAGADIPKKKRALKMMRKKATPKKMPSLGQWPV